MGRRERQLRTRGRAPASLALAVVTGLLLAACGSAGGPASPGSPTPGPASSSTPAGAATSTSSATPSGPARSAAPTGPAPTSTEAPEDLPRPSRTKGRTVTVSGTLEQGVEPTCVLLGNYLLLGGPRTALRPGRTVTVTGRLVEGVVTTCQQGTPLSVDRVTPAEQR